jgi:hypothetical protein
MTAAQALADTRSEEAGRARGSTDAGRYDAPGKYAAHQGAVDERRRDLSHLMKETGGGVDRRRGRA